MIDFAQAGCLPDRRSAGRATSTSQPPAGAKPFHDDYDGEQHTTSFSIVDRFGNAIGVTPTLGGLFGNNVVVGNTGLLLNNGMRLGSTSPYPTDVNYVGAGKIPILNNSPVVVLKDGKLAFVFGTPGGETIGQTEFQVLVNLIDFDLPVQQAIEAPRFVLDAKPNFYKPGAEISREHRESHARGRRSRRSRRWGTSCACCPAGAASATCRRSASIRRPGR